MLELITLLLAAPRSALRRHADLLAENLLLRHQRQVLISSGRRLSRRGPPPSPPGRHPREPHHP